MKRNVTTEESRSSSWLSSMLPRRWRSRRSEDAVYPPPKPQRRPSLIAETLLTRHHPHEPLDTVRLEKGSPICMPPARRPFVRRRPLLSRFNAIDDVLEEENFESDSDVELEVKSNPPIFSDCEEVSRTDRLKITVPVGPPAKPRVPLEPKVQTVPKEPAAPTKAMTLAKASTPAKPTVTMEPPVIPAASESSERPAKRRKSVASDQLIQISRAETAAESSHDNGHSVSITMQQSCNLPKMMLSSFPAQFTMSQSTPDDLFPAAFMHQYFPPFPSPPDATHNKVPTRQFWKPVAHASCCQHHHCDGDFADDFWRNRMMSQSARLPRRVYPREGQALSYSEEDLATALQPVPELRLEGQTSPVYYKGKTGTEVVPKSEPDHEAEDEALEKQADAARDKNTESLKIVALGMSIIASVFSVVLFWFWIPAFVLALISRGNRRYYRISIALSCTSISLVSLTIVGTWLFYSVILPLPKPS